MPLESGSISDSITNVLVVGSGGREHALAWKIRQSPLVGEIYVAPGNGGMHDISVPINSTDISGLAGFATRKRCFTIVGPEVPLSLGIVDKFRESSLPIFGPTREQAKLESSKKYSKELLRKKSIPTAQFETFDDPKVAMDYAARHSGNVVVKADGLAAGKGVVVCSSIDEAENAIRSIMVKKEFGEAGGFVVIEEKLEGREVSLMTLCNGKSNDVTFLGTATDHKRLLNNDKGPNTGGLGAYSPALDFDNDRINEVIERVVRPIVSETSFTGFLYTGLMITDKGLKVLEFNARLGDPETQVILPRLYSDLFGRIVNSQERNVDESGSLIWNDVISCCVAMCSEGYPSQPRTGDVIHGLESVDRSAIVFHGGTKKLGNSLVTAGGRVLYVTSSGPSLEIASARAYEAVSKITWTGEYHRSDIGKTRAQTVTQSSK